MNIKKHIPMIVLPCSAKKQSYACAAKDLYQGKGYLPILNNCTSLTDGEDYHLFFVSALYGLIAGTTVIEPYDMKMSASRRESLAASTMLRTRKLLSLYEPSRIVACLPKEYLGLLQSQLSSIHRLIPCTFPARGDGIGKQRGLLKRELTLIINGKPKPKSMRVWVFKFSDNPRLNPNSDMQITVTIGDMITPWLSGVGESAIIGKPEIVVDIVTSGGSCYAVTERGARFSSTDIAFGLSEQERARGFSIIGSDTIFKNLEEKTIPITALRETEEISLVS
jgi:hypothetical protein